MINVLVELERLGQKYEWAGDNEVKCKCPFHDDTSPSAFINIEKRLFRCQAAGCNKSGDIITFIAKVIGVSRTAAIAELSTRYNLQESKIIDVSTIERYHKQLFKVPGLINELKKRGVSEAAIRKYRLGEHNGRITIPIKNEHGLYVNVRRYLPGAPGADKMRNAKTRGSNRLYPIDQMSYERIMVVGGEIKAIAAAEQLNARGIGAISNTAGESNWDSRLCEQFAGKTVYVCMDIDEAGRLSRDQASKLLYRHATRVFTIDLPLNIDEHPKGDINDFIHAGGNACDLIETANAYEPSLAKLYDESEEPIDCEFIDATVAKSTGKRVRVHGVVAALDDAPYIIPSTTKVLCDRQQPFCATCPIYLYPPDDIHKITPESPAIMSMIDRSKRDQREALMDAFSIPRMCSSVDFEPQEFYTVQDARLSPRLELTTRGSDRIMQPAYCIGENLESNENYVLVGRMHPHPKTQKSTLIISQYETADDALSTYKAENLDDLCIFQSEHTIDGVKKQLNMLYEDLEANVTNIYRRRQLHLVLDLVYHSPLLFNLDGRVQKGWAEAIIVGDSSQGKSATASNLMNFYGLGESVDCKSASVAGLLGGLQQIGGRWFVTWGALPTHDKRLVILEELKGTSQEVISKLTETRSSGVASIQKIERRKTHARTRIIALSNPRGSRNISSFNYGIQAIVDLVGNLEDLRRFDIAAVVSAEDIPPQELNQLQCNRPQVQHRFTNQLCRSLILWSWTRNPDQVVFEAESSRMLLEEGVRLSNIFTDSIPLLDRGSTRYKLARLAAALAARLFSCDSTMQKIVVKPFHVLFISELLEKLYSSHAFGYAEYTKAYNYHNNISDPAAIKAQILATPEPRVFLQKLMFVDKIELQDVMDWCAWDRVEALTLISQFVRHNAFKRHRTGYIKSSAFSKLLSEMFASNEFDRPAHIPKEEF